MKSFFYRITQDDLTEQSGKWYTGVVDLYDNDVYKNYSLTKSRYGISGPERTFIGHSESGELLTSSEIESTSPVNTDTGILESVYVDQYEEYRPARYLDRSGRIDIVRFVSLGTQNPTLHIKNSDLTDTDDVWEEYSVSLEDTYPIVDASPKAQFYFDEAPNADFEVLVEIQIDKPVMAPLYRATRGMMDKYPEWMAMREQPVATDEPATPETVGGQFINAVSGETIDELVSELKYRDFQRFIGTVDTSQMAWSYVSVDVPDYIWSIEGDGTELTRVHDHQEFIKQDPTEHAALISDDNRVFTVQEYTTLTVNGVEYDQVPHHEWNYIDEIGAMVDLERLHLEDNQRYKQRILDVYENRGGVGVEQFKLALRRELDLWRYEGATPDSNYEGATPEVLEISDIEKDPKYTAENGIPTPEFVQLVEILSREYPTTWGRFEWGEAIWDAGGRDAAGYGVVPYQYDTELIPADEVQSGVGDADDLFVYRPDTFTGPRDYNATLKVRGRQRSTRNEYRPVSVELAIKGIGDRDYYSQPEKTVWYTVEVVTTGATPGTFIHSFKLSATSDVNNANPTPTPASWSEYEIFSQQAQTTREDIDFVDPDTNVPYAGTGIIDHADIDSIKLVQGRWIADSYQNIENEDHFEAWFSHNDAEVLDVNTAPGSEPSFGYTADATPYLPFATVVMKSLDTESPTQGTWESEEYFFDVDINTLEPYLEKQPVYIDIPDIQWDPYVTNKEIEVRFVSENPFNSLEEEYGGLTTDQDDVQYFVPENRIAIIPDGGKAPETVGAPSANKPMLLALDQWGTDTYLDLPGTEGNYASIPDINILGSNAAHPRGEIPAHIGGYWATPIELDDDAYGQFSYSWFLDLDQGSPDNGRYGMLFHGSTPSEVLYSGSTYTIGAMIKADVGLTVQLSARLYSEDGSQFSDLSGDPVSVVATGDWQWVTQTKASAPPWGDFKVTPQITVASTEDLTSDLRVGATMVAKGTVSTFVPSTRITGDLDISIDFSPSQVGESDILLSKWLSTTATRSYSIRRATNGIISLDLSDGTTLDWGSGNNTAVAEGERATFRAIFDASEASTTYELNGVPDGSEVRTVNSLNGSSNQDLKVGIGSTGLDGVYGRIYSFTVRDGIDGPVVASYNFNDAERGETQWTTDEGHTLSLTQDFVHGKGQAEIAGKVNKAAWLPGESGNYIKIEDVNLLDTRQASFDNVAFDGTVAPEDRYEVWGTGGGTAAGSFTDASPFLIDKEKLKTDDRHLFLPGESGNYGSIPDVNRVPSDHAHFANLADASDWGDSTSSVALSIDGTDGYFGDGCLTATNGSFSGDYAVFPLTGTLCNATAGEVISASVYVKPSRTVECNVGIRFADSGNTAISEPTGIGASIGGANTRTCPADEWTQIDFRYTAPANTSYVRPTLWVRDMAANDVIKFDAMCVREGSDPTFVPSTRIVGDLDVRADFQLPTGEWQNDSPIISRLGGSSERSWTLNTHGSTNEGKVYLATSTDGSTLSYPGSDIIPALTSGERVILRATRVAATGDVSYTVDEMDAGGSTTVAGDIFVNNLSLGIGAHLSGGNKTNMNLYSFKVRDGIDGPVVASFGFTDEQTVSRGDTSWTTPEGHSLTLSQTNVLGLGQAEIRGGTPEKVAWLPGQGGNYFSIDDVNLLDTAQSTFDNTDYDSAATPTADTEVAGSPSATKPMLINKKAMKLEDQHLSLPGHASNHASMPDVNLLDADTAHLEQSVGMWVSGTTPEIAQPTLIADDSAFGAMGAGFDVTQAKASGTSYLRTNGGSLSIVGGTEYSVRVFIRQTSGTPVRIGAHIQQNNGSTIVGRNAPQLYETPGEDGDWIEDTIVTQGDAVVGDIIISLPDPLVGDEYFVISAVCIRTGSDPTFVPSTRIVGDIDLRADVYVDSTPTTTQNIIARFGHGNHGYRLYAGATGNIGGAFTVGGTSIYSSFTGFGDIRGQRQSIRVTRDATTGDVVGYLNGTPDTPNSAASGPIDIDTSNLQLGVTGNTELLQGSIYSFEVRDGIDGPVVASFDFSDEDTIDVGDTSATTPEGHSLTINQNYISGTGQAAIKGGVPDQMLWLPGQADNHASIPDANLLDADTAHLEQSIGSWSASGPVSIGLSADQSYFGSNSLLGSATGDGNLFLISGRTDITEGQQYSSSIFMYLPEGQPSRNVQHRLDWYDNTNTRIRIDVLETVSLVPGQWVEISGAATAPAGAVGVDLRPYVQNALSGEEFYLGVAYLGEGSDPTFVPSTRVLGDVDIRVKFAPSQVALGSDYHALVAKRVGNSGEYQFRIQPGGDLQLGWFESGTAEYVSIGTSNPSTGDGEPVWLRATRDNDGSSGNALVEVFESLDGMVWTSLGTGTGGSSAAPTATNNPVKVGDATTSQHAKGAMLYFEIRDGIDGPIVASGDFTDPTEVTGDSWTTPEGHAASISRSGDATAEIVDRSCWAFVNAAEKMTINDSGKFNPGTNNLSVSARFSTRQQTGPFSTLVGKRAGGDGDGYLLDLRVGPGDMEIGGAIEGDLGNAVPTQTAAAVNDGQWYTGTLQREGASSIRLYLDGASAGSVNVDPGSVSNAEPITILGDDGALISYAVILMRDLTATELSELAAWDGTIENEPYWLRTDAVLYINADDPDVESYYNG